MEPSGKLPPQAWMKTPETRGVMKALSDAGVEARFIGGCVRDSLLKRPVRDIDIATPVEPDRIIQILEAANIHAIPTGIEHGTITAVINKHHFEITTLRVDVETDGRRARVSFTDDWTRDAARRDFTINCLSANEAGDIYDPYDGLEDLGRGRIRFVGRAHQRIEEDVLRLLRFFRFYAEYGKPPINSEALAACRFMAPRLGELSGERVRGEVFRILMAPNPADTVTLMRAEGVLETILPEAGDVGRLRVLSWLLERGINLPEIEITPVRRLAALIFPDSPRGDANVGAAIGEAVARRLKFSNAERRHLIAMLCPVMAFAPDMSEQAVRRVCYESSAEGAIDTAVLAWAGSLAREDRGGSDATEQWLAVIRTAQAWEPLELPVQGADALALGAQPGPAMGAALKKVEAWWIDGDFRADRAACLGELQKHV